MTSAVNVVPAPTRTGSAVEMYGGVRLPFEQARRGAGCHRRPARRRGQEVGRGAVVQDDRASGVVRLDGAGTGRAGGLDLGALDQRRGAVGQADLAEVVRREGVGDGEGAGGAVAHALEGLLGHSRPGPRGRGRRDDRVGRLGEHLDVGGLHLDLGRTGELGDLAGHLDVVTRAAVMDPLVWRTNTPSDAVCVARSMLAAPVPGVWM